MIYERVSPWKMVHENCVATHIGSEILVDFSKSRKRQKPTFPTERRQTKLGVFTISP